MSDDKLIRGTLRYKMSRIKGTETKPELAVRSLLHRLGFRFRKNVRELPGKPDIVLPKYSTIVFVHGCFWHQHPGCKKCKIPKSNVDFWKDKLQSNIKRDRINSRALKVNGWKIIVVWECELKDPDRLTDKLLKGLRLDEP